MTYATSPQGGDHTAGPVAEDPLSPHGQAKRSRDAQISMAAFDCLGMCWFTFIVGNYELLIPMLNAMYGLDWDRERYLEMGRAAIRLELAFNRKAGLGPEQEQMPQWLKEEALLPLNATFDVPEEDYGKVWETLLD